MLDISFLSASPFHSLLYTFTLPDQAKVSESVLALRKPVETGTLWLSSRCTPGGPSNLSNLIKEMHEAAGSTAKKVIWDTDTSYYNKFSGQSGQDIFEAAPTPVIEKQYKRPIFNNGLDDPYAIDGNDGSFD